MQNLKIEGNVFKATNKNNQQISGRVIPSEDGRTIKQLHINGIATHGETLQLMKRLRASHTIKTFTK
jgi:hypothetical protein